MGKRKKGPSIPRHKRMRRENRLQAAKLWLTTYPGKNVVRGYARHFAVDLLCAVKELEILGNQFQPEYVDQLKRTIAAEIERKLERKRLRKEQEKNSLLDTDDEFSFVAGYTTGGAPFGMTWEEMGSYEDCSSSDEGHEFEDRLDDIDMDDADALNSQEIHESRWSLEAMEEDDDLPF